ncbi:MAG: hypothetical protein Q8O14_03885, partial [bacterium]|nr:hypothetical protein [bacterium]
MNKALLKFVAVLLLGGPPLPLPATVWMVPDPWPLIQQAVDSCASGDTVLVAPGHYHERLVIPDKTLTLASHALLTGDTLFIPQTIVDGDSLGTVIRVDTRGPHRFILDGFLIRGGVGQQWVGGGIHFTDSTDVELRRLHFTRNLSNYSGACLFMDGLGPYYHGPKRFSMQHVRVYDNSTNDRNKLLFSIRVGRYAAAHDVRVDGMVNSRLILVASGDSVLFSDIVARNVTCTGILIGGGLSTNTSHSYQEFKNILIEGCTWSGNSLVNFGGTSPLIIKNIRFIDNTQVGNRQSSNKLLALYVRGDPCHLDSLIFLRNRGVTGHSVVGEWERARLFNDPWAHGRVTNMIVEDCVLGDSSFTTWNASSNYPSMLTTTNLSLEHARFVNNTVILTPGASTPAWGVHMANILKFTGYNADSMIMRNVLFKDNLVIDRDIPSQMSSYWANDGYCAMIHSNSFDFFLIDSVTFDGNRQPNMAFERPYGGYLSDPVDVGSVMLISVSSSTTSSYHKTFQNLIFRNNNEASIRSKMEGPLHFRNVLMLATSRQGFNLEALSVTMDNVWIDSCTAFAPIPFRSEQMPLRLKVTEPSFIRNTTITNSQTPYLVMPGYRNLDAPADPVVTFENCLFWNNQIDRLEAELPQYEWPGWNHDLPGIYRHCLLPQAMPLGEGNLVDVDPLFDAELGIPWLSPASPCIDAGTPNSLWQDAEDPESPGFALWPSQGTRRNDMGFTGGPRAAVFDTACVALPRWEPRTQPQPFTLGVPWP